MIINCTKDPNVQPVSRGGTGKTTHTSNSVLIGNGSSNIGNVASANGALYATSANGAPKFGTLPIAQGGTGATTVAGARKNLGLGNTTGAVPVANGGTGATNASEAVSNLGVADYIVESGEATPTGSITARWEKWASGKAVIEFNYKGTAAAGTAWATPIYYSDYTSFNNIFASIKSGLFIEAPNVIATSNSSVFIGVIPSNITVNGIGSLRYLSINKRESSSGEAMFRAVGKWK